MAINKLDKWHIGDRVLAMREHLTCAEIADEVNMRYRPAGEPPVNRMTISRYCNSHGITDRRRNDIKTAANEHFDTLEEAEKVRKRLVAHTNRIGELWENIKGDEEKLSELASISNAYMNALKMQQELNISVSKIQKEQLGMAKVRKVLSIILSTLDKHPEVRAEILKNSANRRSTIQSALFNRQNKTVLMRMVRRRDAW